MSILAVLATISASAFLLGRLSTWRTIRRLKAILRATSHAANHDRLTQLPNRRLARLILTTRIMRRQPTLVCLLDLDGFKKVNDTHGHTAGDDLLKAIARRLSHKTARRGGCAARLGGDEFLLILPLPPFPGDFDGIITVIAIQVAIADPVWISTNDGLIEIRPSASVGIAAHDQTDHGDSEAAISTLIHRADLALYHAKQRPGAVRICQWQPDMHMPHTNNDRRTVRDLHLPDTEVTR